jgi:hypothetical protein
MEKQTTKPKGFRKHTPKAEPKAAEPEAKGFRKWNKSKFAGKDWDGTFVDLTESPLTIRKDILEAYQREGLDFKWARESTYGQPDPKNIAMHLANGWEAVEEGDFEDIHTVKEGGLVLMARPKAISDKARTRMEQEAKQPIHTMQIRAGEGVTVPMPGGGEHSSARGYNKIRSTREAMQVPDDRNRIEHD